MPALLFSLLPQFLHIVVMRVGRDSREGTSAVHQVSVWKRSVFSGPDLKDIGGFVSFFHGLVLEPFERYSDCGLPPRAIL